MAGHGLRPRPVAAPGRHRARAAARGGPPPTRPPPCSGRPASCRPSRRAVARGARPATCSRWGPDTSPRFGAPVALPDGHDRVRSVSFSPDGRLLVSAGDDGNARLWNVSSGTPAKTFTHRAVNPFGRPLSQVTAFNREFPASLSTAFGPGGKVLANLAPRPGSRAWPSARTAGPSPPAALASPPGRGRSVTG
ncbi:WD40 repeat domain-containing protein [Actinomadura madurae]|uniref:WD40 repeat domain-containing protein n=1 Tax=Actinomadura madurae TaxID=1993 RepID=UPI0032B02BFD